MKFAMYGTICVAPSLYGYVKWTSQIIPGTNLRTAIIKTAIEQVTYGPFAVAMFLFIISLMDHMTIEESKQEVAQKFWPVYKVRNCTASRNNYALSHKINIHVPFFFSFISSV